MKRFSAILALLLSISIICTAQAPITKIFIVRHADRNGNLDALTALGVTRTKELARVLGLAKIDSIFSTNFVRTKQTAQPLASMMGLPIILYTDPAALVARIMKFSNGKRILVVGHSDTVDDIISKCGCVPPPSITPQMPATQFDNMFEVLVQKIPGQNAFKCEVIHMKYGAITN
jgi:broad specificity phosphatase PhoE